MQTILISILTAAITTKIIATYYFKKIDGYVEKMCEMTLKSNEKTVAIILRICRTEKIFQRRRTIV